MAIKVLNVPLSKIYSILKYTIVFLVPEDCVERWWTLEVTPGYHLHTDVPNSKAILNTTLDDCYRALITHHGDKLYRYVHYN